MTRLRQLLALKGAERRLLLLAFFVVLLVRLGLWVLPFGTFCRRWSSLVARMARPGRARPLPARKIVWLVTVASRYVPDAHCLTRSFAAHLLLARHGHQARLLIGVRKDDSRLDAHAWLEHEGAPLFERVEHLGRYRRLTAIDPWPGTPDGAH